jgi:transcriptional regulator
VHINGRLAKLNDAELFASLHSLSNKHEESRNPKFDIHELSPEFLKKELRGIIGFRLDIEDIQVTYKLSQNRNEGDFKNIIENLESTGNPNGKEVAKAMRNARNLL